MIEVEIRSQIGAGRMADDIYVMDFPTHPAEGSIYRNLEVVNGEVVWREFVRKPGAIWDIKPLMSLDSRIAREVAGAFAALAQNLGLKPHDLGKVEGMLEAQTRHLEDMRRLVFDQQMVTDEKNHAD